MGGGSDDREYTDGSKFSLLGSPPWTDCLLVALDLLRLLRRRRKIRPPMSKRPTTPPATPPAIAATGVLELPEDDWPLVTAAVAEGALADESTPPVWQGIVKISNEGKNELTIIMFDIRGGRIPSAINLMTWLVKGRAR
jgi:hypothetical protein